MSIHDRDETLELIQCAICIHLNRTQDDFVCPAYPNGILDIVLSNEWKHDKILPGQKGNYIFNTATKDQLAQDNYKARPVFYRNGGQVHPDLAERKLLNDFLRRIDSPTACGKCKHWDGLDSCPAFPTGGIPEDIGNAITPHLVKDWRQIGDTVFEPE